MRGNNKKKQDISQKEMRTLISAMDQPQFRDMLSEYIDQISDPKGREQYEKYLTQQEQRNDLPPGTKLIRPTAGFCLKTMAKKIVTHASSQFFEQKVFINICASEQIAKPQFTPTVQANGEKGSNVSMPYHYSQGRPDRDANNALCYTYDCVFNPRVIDICHAATPQHNFAFKKFVCDTAIDGLNKILSKHNEKASGDYKIMVNMKCKGGKPATLSVKISDVQEESKKEGFEMDPSKHKTKLEKDINKQIKKNKEEEEEGGEDDEKDGQMADVDDQIPFTDEVLLMEQIKKHGRVKNAMQQRLRQEIVNAKKPVDGQIIEPSYKIVEKYGVDLTQFFGKDQDKRNDNSVISANAGKRPSQLQIKIFLPTVKSIKKAQLDINEREIKFKYKDMFHLERKLPYVVDADKGSAKFDKGKEMLVISVPVTSSLEQEEEEDGNKVDEVVKHGLVEVQDQKVNSEEKQENIEQSKEDEAIEIKPKIDTELLQIEQENQKKKEQMDQMKDKIKFFPSELKEQQGQQPESLIQQIPQQLRPPQTQANNSIKDKLPTLDWQTSPRIQSNYTFKQTSDLIFILLNIKKYKKEQVQYILTQDQVKLQVWDPNQHKIQKTCIQLTHLIIPENSKVQFLNNYISIKMQKLQKGKHWDQIGIDVSIMKPIDNRRINSNFIGEQAVVLKNDVGNNAAKNDEISDEDEQQQLQEAEDDDKKSEASTLKATEVEQRLANQQTSRPKPSLIPLTSELILQIS